MANYALTETAAPSVEPVSTADMKAWLRVDHSDEDTLIAALVAAARQEAEQRQNRSLITTTWTLKLDAFPSWTILVPRPPLQSVTHVKHYDTDGVQQTLTVTTDYVVDTDRIPGRITPAYGEDWPSTRDMENAVEIQFVAGYGDAATDVPASTIAGIKMLVGHWYENREAVAAGQMAEVPLSAASLLEVEQVLRIV